MLRNIMSEYTLLEVSSGDWDLDYLQWTPKRSDVFIQIAEVLAF